MIPDTENAVELLLAQAQKAGAAATSGSLRCASVLLGAYDPSRWVMHLDELALLDRDLKEAAMTVIGTRVKLGPEGEPHRFIENGKTRFDLLWDLWEGTQINVDRISLRERASEAARI